MYQFITLLHVFCACVLGMYLFFPALIGRASTQRSERQLGYAQVLLWLNRIGQYALIGALITGVVLVFIGATASHMWMGLALLLLIGIGAFSGVMAKPLKRWQAGLESGEQADKERTKARKLSMLAMLSYVAVIALMLYPNYF